MKLYKEAEEYVSEQYKKFGNQIGISIDTQNIIDFLVRADVYPVYIDTIFYPGKDNRDFLLHQAMNHLIEAQRELRILLEDQ